MTGEHLSSPGAGGAGPVQIAYCTDRRFLEPTLVSLYSLLKNTNAPVRVHIFGYQLTQEDRQAAQHLTSLFPDAQLEIHEFDTRLIEGVGTQMARIHPMTFARLFLHRYLSGRVLYLDGDTYIRGDIAPLFSMDMRGNLLAGVFDSVVSELFHYRMRARHAFVSRREIRKRERIAKATLERTGLRRINHYINGGVLLFELDAIKNHPNLIARMEDVASASRLEFMDQDWINMVFAGRIKRLRAEWNWYTWRRNKSAFPQVPENKARHNPVIIHYFGKHKPWRDPVPLHKLLTHRLLKFRPKVFWHLEYQRVHHDFRCATAVAGQQACRGEQHKGEQRD